MFKSKIGIGTVQFGLNYGISNSKGMTSSEEVAKILVLAKENGINTIDTASAYGLSEKVIGENELSTFNIISKFLPPQNGETINDQFEKSLLDLKVNYLYGYLAHRPLEVVKNPNQWEDLIGLKEKGKVQKIGFSFNEPHEVELALYNNFIPDIVQVPFNYFDNRFLPYINLLKKRNCEIHTRSTFLQGLFFMKVEDISSHFDFIKPTINELQQLYEKDLAGMLLNYCLLQENIDKVIIGMNDSNQLKENLDAIKTTKTLPELTIKVLDEILNPSKWKLIEN